MTMSATYSITLFVLLIILGLMFITIACIASKVLKQYKECSSSGVSSVNVNIDDDDYDDDDESSSSVSSELTN